MIVLPFGYVGTAARFLSKKALIKILGDGIESQTHVDSVSKSQVAKLELFAMRSHDAHCKLNNCELMAGAYLRGGGLGLLGFGGLGLSGLGAGFGFGFDVCL